MLFRDFPIRRKLRAVILLTTGIALVLTCGVFIAYELITFRKAATEDLKTLGNIIAENSSAALAFNNDEDGRKVLMSLHAETEAIAAALYDNSGKIFVHYARVPSATIPAAPGVDGVRFEGSHLVLFLPIQESGKRFGTLFLESDLSDMYARIARYGVIAAAVLGGSFIVALLLSNVLQKSISTPIASLAGTARSISERRDYSVRAKKESGDELGLLTDAFNQMLDEIHKNQMELSAALEESKRSAAMVNEMNLTLERRVQERTRELQDAVAQMEAFSYSVSHDLRGPLRSMQGYAHVMLEDYGNKLDETAISYLQKISNSATRMDTLIQDILTYSRVARSELKIESINLEKLLNELVAQNPAFQPPNADVVLRSPLERVAAHEAALTQCMTNLLSNAVKFVPAGVKPRIEIWTTLEDSFVKIHVQDNGIGIKPEHFEKIFRMFERVHAARTYEGTGIGLAIVKKAVDRMGGQVGVESEPGKGARFWIKLPRK